MEAVRLVKYRGWSTRKVARHTGFSQSVIVKWGKKDPTGGWHRIPTQSSKPHSHSKQLSQKKVNAIIQKRKQLKRSAEVIHKALVQDRIRVSLSSIKRTLDRKGLLNKRSPWKRYHAPEPRPTVAKPGDLVQVDTIHLMVGTKRIYVFTLLNVYSRWAYAKAYEHATTASAANFLKRAQKNSRFPFFHIQSDHGSEFSTHFTERIGVPHRHSRVRMPNDNAHLERFNRTIQKECLDDLSRNILAINRALPKYLRYYNTQRFHFGINLLTPSQLIPSY